MKSNRTYLAVVVSERLLSRRAGDDECSIRCRHCTLGSERYIRYARSKELSLTVTARKLGVPIYQLLGGPVRKTIKVYAWIGGDRPSDVAKQA